jgi:hypothetical protein
MADVRGAHVASTSTAKKPDAAQLALAQTLGIDWVGQVLIFTSPGFCRAAAALPIFFVALRNLPSLQRDARLMLLVEDMQKHESLPARWTGQFDSAAKQW